MTTPTPTTPAPAPATTLPAPLCAPVPQRAADMLSVLDGVRMLAEPGLLRRMLVEALDAAGLPVRGRAVCSAATTPLFRARLEAASPGELVRLAAALVAKHASVGGGSAPLNGPLADANNLECKLSALSVHGGPTLWRLELGYHLEPTGEGPGAAAASSAAAAATPKLRKVGACEARKMVADSTYGAFGHNPWAEFFGVPTPTQTQAAGFCESLRWLLAEAGFARAEVYWPGAHRIIELTVPAGSGALQRVAARLAVALRGRNLSSYAALHVKPGPTLVSSGGSYCVELYAASRACAPELGAKRLLSNDLEPVDASSAPSAVPSSAAAVKTALVALLAATGAVHDATSTGGRRIATVRGDIAATGIDPLARALAMALGGQGLARYAELDVAADGQGCYTAHLFAATEPVAPTAVQAAPALSAPSSSSSSTVAPTVCWTAAELQAALAAHLAAYGYLGGGPPTDVVYEGAVALSARGSALVDLVQGLATALRVRGLGRYGPLVVDVVAGDADLYTVVMKAARRADLDPFYSSPMSGRNLGHELGGTAHTDSCGDAEAFETAVRGQVVARIAGAGIARRESQAVCASVAIESASVPVSSDTDSSAAQLARRLLATLRTRQVHTYSHVGVERARDDQGRPIVRCTIYVEEAPRRVFSVPPAELCAKAAELDAALERALSARGRARLPLHAGAKHVVACSVRTTTAGWLAEAVESMGPAFGSVMSARGAVSYTLEVVCVDGTGAGAALQARLGVPGTDVPEADVPVSRGE